MSGVGGHPSASEAEDRLSPPRPRLMKTSHPDATGVPRSPRSPTLTSQASTVTLINALALPNLPVTLLNSFLCGDKDLDPVEASVWPPWVLPGIPVAQDISEFHERPWCQDPKGPLSEDNRHMPCHFTRTDVHVFPAFLSAARKIVTVQMSYEVS